MRRPLLVAHQNVLDFVLLEKLVVNEKDRAAGIAEDVLDSFRLEALYDNLCARQFHGFSPSVAPASTKTLEPNC